MSTVTAMRRELKPLGLYNLNAGSLISCELEAYGAGLDPLWDRMNRVLASALILTADTQALEKYERLMAVSVKTELSLVTRRDLLLYRLSVAPYDFNLAGMLGSLRAAGIQAEIDQYPQEERLTVQTKSYLDHFVDLDDLKEKVYAMLPAHLEADLSTSDMTWELFDEVDRSWDSLEGLNRNWNEAELYGHLLEAERSDG